MKSLQKMKSNKSVKFLHKETSYLNQSALDHYPQQSTFIQKSFKDQEDKEKKRIHLPSLRRYYDGKEIYQIKESQIVNLIIEEYIKRYNMQPQKDKRDFYISVVTHLHDKIKDISHLIEELDEENFLNAKRILALNLQKLSEIKIINGLYFYYFALIQQYYFKTHKSLSFFLYKSSILFLEKSFNNVFFNCLKQMGQFLLRNNREYIAIGYYYKMMAYAWKAKQINYELQAYDFIGKCFYYMGNLRKAYYMHNRMALKQLQGNSQLKKSVIKLIKIVNKRNQHVSVELGRMFFFIRSFLYGRNIILNDQDFQMTEEEIQILYPFKEELVQFGKDFIWLTHFSNRNSFNQQIPINLKSLIYQLSQMNKAIGIGLTYIESTYKQMI